MPEATLDVPYAHRDEQEPLAVLLDQTRRFLTREVFPESIDREGKIPTSVIERAAQVGLFGLAIPEEYGGAGLSLKATGRIVQELATVDRSVAIMVGLHCGLGTRSLIECGAPELRSRWLPALASGERVASFAATEPGAGSDLGAVRTTVMREGNRFRLDGEKCYVTNGGFAGLFTVLVRSPGLGGTRAHSLVSVPREREGVSIGPEEEKLGIRGSSTVTVRFEGVEVHPWEFVGTAGRGMEQVHRALAWGRTLMSFGCVGTAQAALELTIAHVTARKQFGRPVGDFVATREQVCSMAAKLFAMESLARKAGQLDFEGKSVEGISLAAKVFCSEGAFEVCDRAVQLHGALGFIEPVGVARLLRDCRITRIFEGANDVLLVRAGVGLVTSREWESTAVVREDTEWKPWMDAVDDLHTRVRSAAAAVGKKYGVSVIHRQLVLQRLARADVCLQAARASVERAMHSEEEKERLLGRHAVEQSVTEGERCLEAMERSGEDEFRAIELSERLYQGRMCGVWSKE